MIESNSLIDTATKAIDTARASLTQSEIELLIATPEEKLGSLHFDLAAKIRTLLGLWEDGNAELLHAIATFDSSHPSVNDWSDQFSVDPDGASAIILKAIRRTILG